MYITAETLKKMLDNWLTPSEILEDYPQESYEIWELGHICEIYNAENGIPEIHSGDLVIVGLDTIEADRVRNKLYRMARPGDSFRILDLGNARKNEGVFNAPIMQEMLAVGATPLFIGREDERCLAQYYGYHRSEFLTNLVLIDDRLRFQARDAPGTRRYLDSIFDLIPVQLYHLAILGYQTHYNDPAGLEYLHQHHFEFYRLGHIKEYINECEPVLRDADAVIFQLSALKASDAHAQEPLGSSGLSSEEACQLCRFSGMADKVSSFGVYGYYAERDPSAQCADTIAQMLWYFIEGFAHRKHDFPVSTEGMTQFIVKLESGAPQLVFWKSERSGRWWLELPHNPRAGGHHQYLSCTYEDYLKACTQKLPDRLIEAYKRFV